MLVRQDMGGVTMSANDKLAAMFHPDPTPHPSFTAMTTAWDPVRREQARTDELARSIDKYTRPHPRSTK